MGEDGLNPVLILSPNRSLEGSQRTRWTQISSTKSVQVTKERFASVDSPLLISFMDVHPLHYSL